MSTHILFNIYTFLFANKNSHIQRKFPIFVDAKKYLFMKQFYLLLVVVFAFVEGLAQTTLASGHPYDDNRNNMGFQFWVENTNSYPIRVFKINMRNDRKFKPLSVTYPYSVWYKNNATNAAPGAITAANGWISAGTYTHNEKNDVEYPLISNLTIDIPANTTCRVWVSTNNTAALLQGPEDPFLGLHLAAAGIVNTFSAGGVNLKTGDSISWWGTTTNGTNINILPAFVGSIEFYQLNNCSGNPEVGSIIGINGGCNGESKFYQLQGYIPANNISYQWQVSTTGPTGTYTNIASSNSTILTRLHSNTNEFIRCIATCGTNRDTTPVFSDSLKAFYFCYCSNYARRFTDTKIDSVVFSGIRTGSPSGVCEFYTDYRGLLPIPKFRAGETYSIEVVNGSCSGNFFTSTGAVFVDLNRNGAWDAADRIGTGWSATSLQQRFTSQLTIPINPISIGITGMRILHREGLGTTPPTNTNMCGTMDWGEAEDYLVEIFKDSNDIRMDSILGLADGCDLGNTNINFKATNIGIKTMNPLVVSYSVNGGTPVTENFASLAPGATASYTFTTQADMSGNGVKVVRVWHQNILDTNKRNDTQVFIINSYPTPPNLVAEHDTVCVNSASTTLVAASNPPFITRWYTDAGTLIDTGIGNSLSYANPTSSITRYAKSVYTVNGKVGPPSILPSVVDAAPNTKGLLFNVMRNKVRINSVKVRFAASGVGAIEIRSPSNTSLLTQSFFVLTANTDVTVPLNIDLPIGTGYRMIMNASPGGAHALNNFTSFPQFIPGVISITGNITATTPPRYNFFFDWDVTYDACSSPVVAVNSVYLSNVNAPIKVLKKDTLGCQYPDIILDAKNIGSTYLWQNGSTLQTIQATTSGVYKVFITNPQGCVTVDSTIVTIKPSPVFSLGNDTTICSSRSVLLKSGFSNVGYTHNWGLMYRPSPEINVASQFASGLNKGIKFDILREGLLVRGFKSRFTVTDSNARITYTIKDRHGFIKFENKDVQIPLDSSNKVLNFGIDKVFDKNEDYTLTFTSMTPNATVAVLNGLSNYDAYNKENVINVKSDESGNTSSYIGFFDLIVSHTFSGGQHLENQYEAKSAGWYYGKVTGTGANCYYETTKNIAIVPSPNAFLGRDTFACNNTPITIKAPVGYTYLWDDGTFGPTRTTSTNGVNKIWVEVTDASNPYGCKSSDTVIVTIASLTKPNLGNDVTTCSNPYSLSIPAAPDREYRWSNGGTGATTMVTNSGDYILTVTQVNTTCSYTDTVKVTINSNPPLDLGSDITTCKNDPITITATPGWTSYSWTPSGFNVNKITVNPSDAASYTLNVVGPCGNASDTIKINYAPGPPSINIGPDTTVFTCSPITLPMGGGSLSGPNVLWSTNETTNTITADKSGTYWATISNECGASTDAVRIIFDTLPTPDFDVVWTGKYASFTNKSINAKTYYWEFGDDSTSTDRHTSHIYDTLDEFEVKLTVKNSCDSSRTITKIINLRNKPSGIASAISNQMNIYPNPAKDHLNIVYPNAINKEYRLELMTIEGRVVYSQSHRLNANNEIQIGLEEFTEGTYLLRSIDKNGAIDMHKITIIK